MKPQRIYRRTYKIYTNTKMIIFYMKNIILLLLLCFTPLTFAKSRTNITDNQVQGRLNIVNGYSTECVMHKFYTNSGWTQIEGEVGRNGIDGLYYKKKKGVIREVLVAESKWNKSRLSRSGKNKLVKQMSQEWVLRTLNKLQKHKPLPEYKSIKKLVKNDQYRARLFKMFPVGKDKIQIHIYKIKNKGMGSFDTFIENTLRPITIAEPANSFERGILESYDRCRKEALRKYFPMLSDKSITELLQDNYLQKKDLKKFLQNKIVP